MPHCSTWPQCEALLVSAPHVVLSIMDFLPEKFVAETKARGMAWFACVTALTEARAAEAPTPLQRQRCRVDASGLARASP